MQAAPEEAYSRLPHSCLRARAAAEHGRPPTRTSVINFREGQSLLKKSPPDQSLVPSWVRNGQTLGFGALNGGQKL
jgi:hypothetical protein